MSGHNDQVCARFSGPFKDFSVGPTDFDRAVNLDMRDQVGKFLAEKSRQQSPARFNEIEDRTRATEIESSLPASMSTS